MDTVYIVFFTFGGIILLAFLGCLIWTIKSSFTKDDTTGFERTIDYDTDPETIQYNPDEPNEEERLMNP